MTDEPAGRPGEPPSPPTADALRALAARCTSTAVERGVGILLGGEPEAVTALVRRLADAGRLGHGLALPALLLAARRGTDAAGAIAELAGGRPLPEDWSDYEVRAAAEEAEEDLRAVLRPPQAGGGAVVCDGPDAPARAALAVRAGGGGSLQAAAAEAHVLDGLSLLRAHVDVGWIARLAEVAGWPLLPRTGAPEVESLASALADGGTRVPTPAREGLDEVVAVEPERLSLLG